MKIKVYEVLREHVGDRPYAAGDRRELDETSAAHLVALGVLRETDEMPPAAPTDPVEAASSAAQTELARLQRLVSDARAAADSEIAAIQQRVVDYRLEAQTQVDTVTAETKSALAELGKKRSRAEIETAETVRALDERKAEIATLDKAETAPANKGEGKAPATKATDKVEA